MHLSWICSLLIISNLQMFRTVPLSSSLTDEDMEVLKGFLLRLEESLPGQPETDAESESQDVVNADADGQWPETGLDKAAIREIFSAKNLKNLRHSDNSRRSSGCFGRRMDRIGSMSSLGCNTVGKYNPKRR